MKPKKLELKEVTLKISLFHVCKFNPQKAEWTLAGVVQPNDRRQLQSSISDMSASLPMNSIVPQRNEEVDVARIATETKELEGRKVEALRAIQTYDDKISRAQH